MVGTTNKSIAAMCGRWLRRNVPQLCPERLSPGLAIYLATVDCAREAQPEQLARDVGRSPKPVLEAHAPDQGPQFCRDGWPSSAIPGFPAPVALEALPIPAQQR